MVRLTFKSQKSTVNSLWSEVCGLWTKKGFSLVEVLVVLSLMALLVLFLGSKIRNVDTEDKFYKTCHIMEEIKEAIIGKPGLYCNGIRQFTGYVSDMGVLPDLFDENGKKVEYNGQPRALWTRDIDGDGNDDLPEWKYYGEAKIWAGWRGPYITPPPDGILKDAWGNPFVFIIGKLVTYNEKTFRCIKTHDCTAHEPHEPGDSNYWEELKDSNGNPIHISAKPWFDPNEVDPKTKKVIDRFYADALEIVSYGKNGKPGGKGLDKDLVLTIYKQEWTGEVAGHAGYKGNPYVGRVTLHYPEKEEVKTASIEIVDNDHGYGINFRFGIACENDDPNCKIDCDYSEPGYICNYTNFKKVAIPIGIRSITTDTGKIYIFPVEATGNWIGTIIEDKHR